MSTSGKTLATDGFSVVDFNPDDGYVVNSATYECSIDAASTGTQAILNCVASGKTEGFALCGEYVETPAEGCDLDHQFTQLTLSTT